MSKYKTTPREKTIIKLMEMVIDTLKYCDDLDAVSYTHLTLPTSDLV